MVARSMILRAGALTALCAALGGGIALSGLLPGPARTQTGPVIAPETASPAPQAATPAPTVSALGLPCGLETTATAMPGAMVALDIIDPCRPEARVEIVHAGVTIAAQTDALGILTLDIPALETPAFFTIRTDEGQESVTLAGVPDLSNFARAAVFWGGDLGLELHAFEGGAEFGAPGHIWQEAPGDPAQAALGTGGALTLLGDASLPDPKLAQIYSVAQDRRAGVQLSVDIPIAATTCGQPIRAQTLQMTPTDPVQTRPITLTLPGCESVGEYLVLQNLFDAQRLASN